MKIAMIGAGFGGMAAAYDLRKAGHEVTIFEAANYVGGLASGFKEPDWDWSVEKFYHHWFQSDRHMLGLIRELGWEDQVLFPRPLTVMYHAGRFYPFDSILKMALFPGLGWGLDKIRFGLVGLFLRLTNNWKSLERVTADQWMQKWAGRRVYEKMWKPLLIGKFGPYYRDVNMAWMWARIKARTTRLGTFQGGFQRFADRFAERLVEMGVDLRLEAQVKSIRHGEAGGLTIDSGKLETFDRVLVTTSPNLLARLCPDLPEAYLKGLLALKSMGAVVMVVSLKHQLSTAGILLVQPAQGGRVSRCWRWWSTPISSAAEHFGGEHIVYAGDYLEAGHEYFTLTDEELLARFLPAFKKFNPAFERDWVNKVRVFQDPVRPTRAAAESLKEYPARGDARGGTVFRLHEPGVSLGPRHQLRRRDRPARRGR